MKRILSLLLCTVLMCTLLPAQVLAEPEAPLLNETGETNCVYINSAGVASGPSGSGYNWTWDPDDLTLTFGNMSKNLTVVIDYDAYITIKSTDTTPNLDWKYDTVSSLPVSLGNYCPFITYTGTKTLSMESEMTLSGYNGVGSGKTLCGIYAPNGTVEIERPLSIILDASQDNPENNGEGKGSACGIYAKNVIVNETLAAEGKFDLNLNIKGEGGAVGISAESVDIDPIYASIENADSGVEINLYLNSGNRHTNVSNTPCVGFYGRGTGANAILRGKVSVSCPYNPCTAFLSEYGSGAGHTADAASLKNSELRVEGLCIFKSEDSGNYENNNNADTEHATVLFRWPNVSFDYRKEKTTALSFTGKEIWDIGVDTTVLSVNNAVFSNIDFDLNAFSAEKIIFSGGSVVDGINIEEYDSFQTFKFSPGYLGNGSGLIDMNITSGAVTGAGILNKFFVKLGNDAVLNDFDLYGSALGENGYTLYSKNSKNTMTFRAGHSGFTGYELSTTIPSFNGTGFSWVSSGGENKLTFNGYTGPSIRVDGITGDPNSNNLTIDVHGKNIIEINLSERDPYNNNNRPCEKLGSEDIYGLLIRQFNTVKFTGTGELIIRIDSWASVPGATAIKYISSDSAELTLSGSVKIRIEMTSRRWKEYNTCDTVQQGIEVWSRNGSARVNIGNMGSDVCYDFSFSGGAESERRLDVSAIYLEGITYDKESVQINDTVRMSISADSNNGIRRFEDITLTGPGFGEPNLNRIIVTPYADYIRSALPGGSRSSLEAFQKKAIINAVAYDEDISVKTTGTVYTFKSGYTDMGYVGTAVQGTFFLKDLSELVSIEGDDMLWQFASGDLPEGIIFNNGRIYGAPSNTAAAGTYTFYVWAKSSMQTRSLKFSLTVAAQPPATVLFSSDSVTFPTLTEGYSFSEISAGKSVVAVNTSDYVLNDITYEITGEGANAFRIMGTGSFSLMRKGYSSCMAEIKIRQAYQLSAGTYTANLVVKFGDEVLKSISLVTTVNSRPVDPPPAPVYSLEVDSIGEGWYVKRYDPDDGSLGWSANIQREITFKNISSTSAAVTVSIEGNNPQFFRMYYNGEFLDPPAAGTFSFTTSTLLVNETRSFSVWPQGLTQEQEVTAKLVFRIGSETMLTLPLKAIGDEPWDDSMTVYPGDESFECRVYPGYTQDETILQLTIQNTGETILDINTAEIVPDYGNADKFKILKPAHLTIMPGRSITVSAVLLADLEPGTYLAKIHIMARSLSTNKLITHDCQYKCTVIDETAYPTYILGTQITSENMTDVLKNGKVSYEPADGNSAAKLTIYPCSICIDSNTGETEPEFNSVIYTEDDLEIILPMEQTVNIEGPVGAENTSSSNQYGIWAADGADITISGKGTLTVTAGTPNSAGTDRPYSIGINCEELRISGVSVHTYGGNNVSRYLNGQYEGQSSGIDVSKLTVDASSSLVGVGGSAAENSYGIAVWNNITTSGELIGIANDANDSINSFGIIIDGALTIENGSVIGEGYSTGIYYGSDSSLTPGRTILAVQDEESNTLLLPGQPSDAKYQDLISVEDFAHNFEWNSGKISFSVPSVAWLTETGEAVVNAVAAQYNKDGQLLDTKLLAVDMAEGVDNAELSFTDVEGAWYKLFLLRQSDLVPLCREHFTERKISEVSLTVSGIAAGNYPSYDAVFPSGSHCHCTPGTPDGVTKNGIVWKKMNNSGGEWSLNSYIDPSEPSVFSGGGSYYQISIYVTPDDGFSFEEPGMLYVQLNDSEVLSYDIMDDGRLRIDAKYQIRSEQTYAVDNKKITNVSLQFSDLRPGGSPSYHPELPSHAKYSLINAESTYSLNDVAWYKGESKGGIINYKGIPISDSESITFTYGGEYRLEIFLSPNAGYSFGNQNINVRINGFRLPYGNVTKLEDGRIKITMDFTVRDTIRPRS